MNGSPHVTSHESMLAGTGGGVIVRNGLAGFGVLALAAVAAIAVNANWDSKSGRPPRLVVSYSGLDLATEDGERLLNGRIRRAVDRICNNGGSYELTALQDERECRGKAWASVRSQVDAAVRRVRDGGRGGRETAQTSVMGDIAAQPNGIRKAISKALDRSFDTGNTANWFSWGARGFVYVDQGAAGGAAGRACRLVTVTLHSFGEQQVMTRGIVCRSADGLMETPQDRPA